MDETNNSLSATSPVAPESQKKWEAITSHSMMKARNQSSDMLTRLQKYEAAEAAAKEASLEQAKREKEALKLAAKRRVKCHEVVIEESQRRLQQVDEAMQVLEGVVNRLKQERYMRFADSQVNETRIGLRDKRPIAENFKDQLHNNLCDEKKTLAASRKELKDREKEVQALYKDLKDVRTALSSDTGNRRLQVEHELQLLRGNVTPCPPPRSEEPGSSAEVDLDVVNSECAMLKTNLERFMTAASPYSTAVSQERQEPELKKKPMEAEAANSAPAEAPGKPKKEDDPRRQQEEEMQRKRLEDDARKRRQFMLEAKRSQVMIAEPVPLNTDAVVSRCANAKATLERFANAATEYSNTVPQVEPSNDAPAEASNKPGREERKELEMKAKRMEAEALEAEASSNSKREVKAANKVVGEASNKPGVWYQTNTEINYTPAEASNKPKKTCPKATIALEPGEMGIVCDDAGFVQKVSVGGQAHWWGIKEGDRILKVGDAQSFSKDDLAREEKSQNIYQVTYQAGLNGKWTAVWESGQTADIQVDVSKFKLSGDSYQITSLDPPTIRQLPLSNEGIVQTAIEIRNDEIVWTTATPGDTTTNLNDKRIYWTKATYQIVYLPKQLLMSKDAKPTGTSISVTRRLPGVDSPGLGYRIEKSLFGGSLALSDELADKINGKIVAWETTAIDKDQDEEWVAIEIPKVASIYVVGEHAENVKYVGSYKTELEVRTACEATPKCKGYLQNKDGRFHVLEPGSYVVKQGHADWVQKIVGMQAPANFSGMWMQEGIKHVVTQDGSSVTVARSDDKTFTGTVTGNTMTIPALGAEGSRSENIITFAGGGKWSLEAMGFVNICTTLVNKIDTFVEKSDEAIHRSRTEAKIVTTAVTKSLARRTMDLAGIKKSLETHIQDLNYTIVTAERSLDKQAKRLDPKNEAKKAQFDSSNQLLKTLRDSKAKLTEDLRFKIEALNIDESCRRVTPAMAAHEEGSKEGKRQPPGGNRKKNMANSFSAPFLTLPNENTDGRTPHGASPSGNSKTLKAAGMVAMA